MENSKYIIKLRYIDVKYNKKHGNGSWSNRLYHNIDRICSKYETFIQLRNKDSLDKRRAWNLFLKDKIDINSKMFKQHLDSETIEYNVLKKDKWRI